MNNEPGLPEPSPFELENPAPQEESPARDPFPPKQWMTESCEPQPDSLQPDPQAPLGADPCGVPPGEPPQLFRQFIRLEAPREERIPNLGHVGILILIALCGLFGASLVARLAFHFHLFGVTNLAQAATEIHYTLGSEGAFYLLTFGGCLLIFPLLWHKGLLAGLHWRGATALGLRGRLIGAAMICFALAMFNGMVMPGPSDAPIDRIFRLPGAAWMLFVFGVTLAPFFEELAFRGFLLPALCTAFDWTAEKATDAPPPPLDENSHPQWSMPAMIIAAILTSFLFALMHADQTGYALGPFVLLMCVSVVLCWARLSTRSLAASVLVHASYNFLLFSFMFLGTSGFRHLDKM